MFDHVGIKITKVEPSVRFYTAALAPLGHVLHSRDDAGAGFGPEGQPTLWLHRTPTGAGPGSHLAFRATDRAAVDRFHAAGLAAGGRDNGAPGVRADYGSNYYAAFLLDPDGNNVEAVCLRPVP
jgi:catechol 2,3-dioxygenase-like lactoylglutathione lyase family enzyme